MTLYAVEIERTQVARIYVEAPHALAAKNDARELVNDEDFDTLDDTLTAMENPTSNGQMVWSGGESGEWGDPR